jgi:hypothetical protein
MRPENPKKSPLEDGLRDLLDESARELVWFTTRALLRRIVCSATPINDAS